MKTTTPTARPGSGRFAPKGVFALVGAVIVLALAVGTGPAGLEMLGAAITTSPASCPDGGPIPTASLPRVVPASECNLAGRTITDGTAQVGVPPRGHVVEADIQMANGDTHSLTVETDAAGAVHINPQSTIVAGHADAGSIATADQLRTRVGRTAANPCRSCQAACNDKTFVLEGYRWDTSQGPFNWYFNRSTTPSGITADQAQDAFIQATKNVTTEKNQCGRPDHVNLTTQFLGDTTAHDNITLSRTGVIGCTATGDGKNVIDFDFLTAPGVTCAWRLVQPGTDSLTESDIRMQNASNWTTDPGTTCNNKFDLQGLATHERGHTFGLAHPDVSTNPIHGNLTMSTYGLGECSKSYRTFGLGDSLGLESLYP